MPPPGELASRPHRWMRLIPCTSLALVLAGSLFAPAIASAQDAEGTWSSPFDHPAAWRLYCAVYDSLHARLIVFGASGGAGQTLDQIWTLSLGDRSEWSSHRVSGVVPLPRVGESAMFDPVRDRVIMFEGDELWALSLSGVPSWTRLQAAGPAPPSRDWHSAVYDSKRDRMIVFGGNHAGTVLGDVWALDLANGPTWEQLAVPMPSAVPRQSHAATFDPVHDRMLVFGSERSGSYPTDTWELSLSGVAAWREIPSTNLPLRIGGTLFYDPVRDRAVPRCEPGTARATRRGRPADMDRTSRLAWLRHTCARPRGWRHNQIGNLLRSAAPGR